MSRRTANKNMGIYYPYNLIHASTDFEIEFIPSRRRYEVTKKVQSYNNISPNPPMPINERCRITWESNVNVFFPTSEFTYESKVRTGNLMVIVGYFTNPTSQKLFSNAWNETGWITRMKYEKL